MHAGQEQQLRLPKEIGHDTQCLVCTSVMGECTKYALPVIGSRTSKCLCPCHICCEPRKLKSEHAYFDAFLLNQTVNEIVTAVNELEGFKVCGWYKPSKQDGDVCAEAHSLHVIRLLPLQHSDVPKYVQADASSSSASTAPSPVSST